MMGTGLRVATVALIILIALQLLVAASTAIVRGRDFGRLSRPALVTQTQATVAILDRAKPENRPFVLKAVSSPFIHFSLLEEFPDSPLAGPPLPVFVPAINTFRRAFPGGREFRIYRRMPQSWSERLFQRRGTVRTMLDRFIIVVRLSDGSAVAVEPSATYRKHMVMNILAAISAIIGLICLGLLLWTGYATTRPLARMADAADDFARDLNAPPMPEEGPKAVRNLARAFNRMQLKIQRLVTERTTTLAAVAHDFRTYLTRLRLRAEFIPDPVQQEKAIHDLDEMAALVDDTLLFARDDAGPMSADPVVFSKLMAELVASQRDLDHNVTLTVTPEARGGEVAAHPTSLKRALGNLIDNAVRYGNEAICTLTREGDLLCMLIRDRGPGVPDEQISRLTDPFFRIESSRSRGTGGAGLGLAITRRLIEGAGGTLNLRNHPDGGLEARVCLPVLKEDPVQTA